jgi:D-3-phosphoglycerate dehydrogenase
MQAMRTVVACPFPEFAIEELGALGCVVTHQPDLEGQRLIQALRDAALLIVDRTRVPAGAIQAADSLQMIVRIGDNVSNIDVDAASERGVFVVHCPYEDDAATAELMFGFILTLDRDLGEHASDLLTGRRAEPKTAALGLAGRTLGVMECSPLARQIALRAQAFDMNVIGWSPLFTPEEAREANVGYRSHARDVARDSEIIAVCAGNEPRDRPLVDAEFVENVRDGAILVYAGLLTALDDAALAEAVRTRGVRLAVDAYVPGGTVETVRVKSGLLELPGVIGTLRLAPRTIQCRRATAAEVVKTVRCFLVNGEIRYCVNLAERSPATWQLVLRLRDTVGVMASVMDAIRKDNINAEEISSQVFRGARAAWCTIALDERPGQETLDAIAAVDGVLHCELRAVV